MLIVLRGFRDSQTVAEHEQFLREFQSTLQTFGLPVHRILSERTTGGAIHVELPEWVELHETTRSLASFAEVLARQTGQDVSFPLEIPSIGFNVLVAGAAP